MKAIARKPGSGCPPRISSEVQVPQIIEEAMCEDDETTATQLQSRLVTHGEYVSLATFV